MTEFRHVRSAADGTALYAWEREPNEAGTRLFYLGAFDADSAPERLALGQSWETPGAYLFCSGELTGGLSGLLGALGLSRERISEDPTVRVLAWLPACGAEGALPVTLVWGGPGWGHVSDVPSQSVPFGNIRLQLSSDVQLELDDEHERIVLRDSSNWRMSLRPLPYPNVPPKEEPRGLAPQKSTLVMELASDSLGSLTGAGKWQAHHCYRVFSDDWRAKADPRGGELRFFVPGGEYGARQLVYPLLPAARESDAAEFGFDLALDPLAVTDASRTYFRFNEDPPLIASGAFTVGGRPVRLRPLFDQGRYRTGFHLAHRPRTSADGPGNPPERPFVYLAPTGCYALDFPPGERPADEGRLMCGTSGLEYLRVRDGDMLEFVPGQPAYAPGFPEGDGGVGLDPSYTTSWVRLRPGPSPGSRGYYAQPAASVHYGHGVVPPQQAGTMGLPAAVSCLVRTLDRATAAAFPMAFYGGTLTRADDPQSAAILSGFERQVLTGLRGACLRQDAAGEDLGLAPATQDDDAVPVPPAPPVFADADGEPLPGGRTTTPGGLLVELNDGSRPPAAKGTWKRVLLAAKGNRTLSFNADGRTGTVDAGLASALVHDQVFLVLNDWSRFKDISAELLLAGFNFELAPPDGDPDTLLVVKRATKRSLTDLADNPADWADPAYFIGGPQAVSRARSTLRAALRTAEDAEGETDDPFGHFRDVIATSPEWTGIIAFNSPINGNGMPESFQMLFAGIDGQLTAHHFGVEANRIRRDRDGLPEIAESSLFGVVHYAPPAPETRPPAPKPFDFRVRELNVAIRNSAVTQFHAKVAMTLNELFGRGVHRATADAQGNEVAVSGRYQERDGVGTVTFEAAERTPFSFADGDAVRVLDAFTVTGAAIVPTSSVVTADGTTVKSRFTLDGELHFRPHPFPEDDNDKGTRYADLDLFSYGTGSGQGDAGLRLSGLALDLTCVLGKDGKRAGDTEITADLGGVQVTHSPAALRDEGMVARLPVTTTGFLYDEQGLTAAVLKGQAVNLVQLAGERGHMTSSPRYALRMDLPLGTLGNLAEAGAGLDASLVLGWGPNTYSPDDDAVGLFIQLPSVTAGAFGFELQGLLKTTFGDANLLQARVTPKGGRQPEPCFVLLFNNVALSVLGIRLPPKVITDFVLFAGEDAETKRRAIAWNLAATQLTASPEGS